MLVLGLKPISLSILPWLKAFMDLPFKISLIMEKYAIVKVQKPHSILMPIGKALSVLGCL